MPRNIGRRNTHNTNPSIAPIIPTNQRRTLFMRLRPEMDALPRLFDMLLFVFIVRHFFYASIDYRSFACSLNPSRAEEVEGCSPFGEKIRADARRSGDFYAEADRISLRRTFSQVKQPIQTRLSMVRPDSKWLPR